jgi:hypothetical protein
MHVREKVWVLDARKNALKAKKKVVVEKVSRPKNAETSVEYVFNKWYFADECRNEQEGRLAYQFYLKYFSECNTLGIDLEEAMDYLYEHDLADNQSLVFFHRSTDEVYGIGEKLYATYSSQHGNFYENAKNRFDEDDEIEAFDVPFRGTQQDKNNVISYIMARLNKKEMDDKAMFLWSLRSKEKGIDKTTFIDYLISNNIVDEVLLDKARSVYNDPYFLFGVKLKENKKKAARLAADYVNFNEEKGYKVYFNTSNPPDQTFLSGKINDVSSIKNYFTRCIKNSVK